MVSWDTLAEGVASIEREANQQILRDQLKPHLCFHTRDRQFRATFGISSELACLLWMMLDVENEGPEGAEPKHLLWTLHFLKTYGSEDVVALHCGVHPDTYRTWHDRIILALKELQLVCTFFRI